MGNFYWTSNIWEQIIIYIYIVDCNFIRKFTWHLECNSSLRLRFSSIKSWILSQPVIFLNISPVNIDKTIGRVYQWTLVYQIYSEYQNVNISTIVQLLVKNISMLSGFCCIVWYSQIFILRSFSIKIYLYFGLYFAPSFRVLDHYR